MARRRVRRPKKRKPNPSFRRSNPGGAITGMVMNGVWVGVGMYAGSIVSGFISPILGGITGSLGIVGSLAEGVLTAYLVGWLGNRTIGHGDLMAAGAFGAQVPGLIGSVLGGAGSIFGSLTGGGNAVAPSPTAPSAIASGAPQAGTPTVVASSGNPLQQVVSGSTQAGWHGTAMPSHTFG
jgi:hypothetical protein